MTTSGTLYARPREIRLAELLLIGGVAIDAVQRVPHFHEWMDGVAVQIGVAVAIAVPILCICLVLLATRLRSRMAMYVVVVLVALGAVISVADYIMQGKPTIGWLMGWAALALQIAAAKLLVSRSARSWLARRPGAVA